VTRFIDGGKAYLKATAIEAYVVERDAALERGDLEWVKNQLPPGTSPTVVLMTLHKARYEAVNISREKRLESASFLKSNNLKRSCGAPLLPDGELPE
jgi:hypothetical protein